MAVHVSNIMIKPNNSMIGLKKDNNHICLPFCSNTLFSFRTFVGHASVFTCSTGHSLRLSKAFVTHNNCESFGHASLHTNPSQAHIAFKLILRDFNGVYIVNGVKLQNI